jgi:hypothetical protein
MASHYGLTDAELSGLTAETTSALVQTLLGQPLHVFDIGLGEMPTRSGVIAGECFVFGGEMIGSWGVYHRESEGRDVLVSTWDTRGEAVEAFYTAVRVVSESVPAVCRGCRYPNTAKGCETPGCLDSIWMTPLVAERLGRVAREASERADGYRAMLRAMRLGGR